MRSMGSKLHSHHLEIFEALANHDRTGLTLPDMVKVTSVPRSTAHRILDDFESRGLVKPVGKRRKAPIYRLNNGDVEVVEAAKLAHMYTLRIAEIEGMKHGIETAREIEHMTPRTFSVRITDSNFRTPQDIAKKFEAIVTKEVTV